MAENTLMGEVEGLIRDCLKTLERQSFTDFEILIIDNASTDESLDEIERFLEGSLLTSHVELISLSANVGFVGGNLEGLKHTRGEYEPYWIMRQNRLEVA